MVNYFQIDQPLSLPTIITEENNGVLTKPAENGQLHNKIVSPLSSTEENIEQKINK